MQSEKISVIKEWLGSGSINFFGLPFAGKDSQASRISELLNGNVLGGGEILRNSEIPLHVKKLIDEGHLAPTEDYIRIVLPYLSRDEFKDKPMLLSSVGRWKGEETAVMKALEKADHPLKAAVFFKVDKNTMIERLNLEENAETRGLRQDDSLEKLEQRIVEFEEKTMPVIEYYDSVNLLLEVDATPPKDQVFEGLIDSIYLLALRDATK